MKKYKLLGVTRYAEHHLDCGDREAIIAMVGCEVSESKTLHIDGTKLIDMPDGETTHIVFLKLDEIQQKLKFE